MNKITSFFFSMQTMGVLILMFAFSIGAATFIENDFGTTASKAVVYNALWFEILLALLTINLTGNIFVNKLYVPKKLTIFIFHLSFIVILIGSAITRYISYEGMMHIRQGEVVNTISSDNTYVDITIKDGDRTVHTDESTLLSVLTQEAYSDRVSVNGNTYSFHSISYIPNAQEVITDMPTGGSPYLSLAVSASGTGRQNVLIKEGQTQNFGGVVLNFGSDFMPEAVNMKYENEKLFIFASDDLTSLSMMTQSRDTLQAGVWHPFELRTLYQMPQLSVVITNFYKNGGVDYVIGPENAGYMNALVVEASDGTQEKTIVLRGGKGYQGVPNTFTLGSAQITMQYGAKILPLPFSLQLVEFQLERYPGSKSPSSYASEVILLDPADNVKMPYRIYMNHVLNYKGFRFFQSSYDPDELGTILSVNHDYWGTFFTYVGYFLMTLGMFLSLFNPNSRFASLGRQIRNRAKTTVAAVAVFLLMAGVMSPQNVEAQTVRNMAHNPHPSAVNKKQATEFGKLLVQSHDGRLKPVNTLTGEILRKVSRKSSFDGQTADQVFLGMMSNPTEWQQVPMIKIGHPEVAEVLGVSGKYASYLDFINLSEGTYKLNDYVSKAYEKKPAARSKFDNEIMKVDERLNICFMVFSGDMLKILPDPSDPEHPWYAPNAEFKGMPAADSMFISSIVPAFLQSVADGQLSQANELLEGIDDFQQKYGKSILPDTNRTKMELLYNKLLIFDNLSKYFGLLGLLMLILLFVEMFRTSKVLRWIVRVMVVLVIIGFIYQTFGLGLRWYISGHAPWSDGYESMIYIGWVTLLAGLIFSGGSKMTLAATTVLTSIILMVAHLSWMDPEVTNLVPVLKSYWLTIHVSIITASYGFFALSALLGFLNLLLMIFRGKNNAKAISHRVKELTIINERSVMIGLYMLTIGTFLGGVWANESWGRYWGWDPKETWALVSVLVYAFVAHMKYMPGMKSNFSYNFAALISFSTIIMTYFGVNYYLSGLHSYAKGDPVPVPSFVYYTVAIVFVVSLVAYLRERGNMAKENS